MNTIDSIPTPSAWWRQYVSARILVSSFLTGGVAYALIKVGVRLPVEGTPFFTDPREIFVTLGASFTGPVGATVIGAILGAARQSAEGIPYRILAYVVAGSGLAVFYRSVIYSKMRMPWSPLGWIVGVGGYYGVSLLVGLGVPYVFDRTSYVSMVGSNMPLGECMLFVAESLRHEMFFTALITSLFLAALPGRVRRPLWGAPQEERELRMMPNDPIGVRLRLLMAGRFLGIRLTIWFILLSIIPFFAVVLFVRDEAQTAFSTIEMMQRREQARSVANLIGDGGPAESRRIIATIRSAVRGQCFVVDEGGRYVAHTDSARTGGGVSEDLSPEVLRHFSTEGMAIYRDETAGLMYGFARTVSGKYLVVSQSSPRFGEHTLMNLTEYLQKRVGLSFLFISLSAGIVIWFVVIRPIHRLTQAVEAVSRDNLSITIPIDHMDDEVRVFGQAFNTMTDELRAAYRGLEEEIAERIAANEEVRKSRGQLAEALRIARMGYFHADPASQTVTMSQEVIEVLNVDGSVRAGEPIPIKELIERIVYVDDRANFLDALRRSEAEMVKPKLLEEEFRIVRKGGELAWVSVYYSYVRQEGRPYAIVGTVQDITDRKRTELEFEASKRKFQAVVENNIDAIMLVDKSGRVEYASPSMEYILGIGPALVEGQSMFDHVQADDLPGLQASFAEVLRRPGSSFRRTYRARHANGSWVWLEAIAKNSLDDPAIHAIVINYRDITERKQADEELVRLRQAVESSTEVVFMTDPDGIFRYVNKAFTLLYGHTAEEVVGKVTPRILKSGLVPKEQYDEFWKTILRAHTVHSELTNQRKDGSQVTVEATADAVVTSSGSILGFLAIQRDISERKKSEAALRHSEQNLRTAQRIGKIGSWEVDILQRRTTWSDETYRIFEKDPATFVLKETTYLDAIHPDDRDMIKVTLTDAVDRGLSIRAQHRIVLERGMVKHLEVMGEVIRSADGSPVRVVGSIQDITESKLAEEALSDKVHRLQLLRELGVLFSGSLNQQEIVEQVSAFIPRHLGVSQVLIRFVDDEGRLLLPRTGDGHGPVEFVPFEDHASTNVSVACMSVKRPLVVNDCRTSPLIPEEWRRETGLRSVLAVPIRTQRSVLGVMRVDDNERYNRFTDADVEFFALVGDQLGVALANARLYMAAKTAEEAKERLNAELERRVVERTAQLESVNKELESFSYSVSHDLRAPLRHISGFVELLRGKVGGSLDDESQRFLSTISQSAVRLGNLIDELLSFSRIGRTDLRTGPVELSSVVAEVVRECEPDTRGRSIEWRVGALPAVNGDATMLKLVLTNLISNALKFTRHRDQAVIEVGSRPSETPGGFHLCFVRDNGAGFDQEYASKLFGVFQRLHTNEEFEGTGIGLANVRRIVQRHGGSTWAEGEVDAGATIWFTLPPAVRS